MKKKFFAVALATTMALSTALAANAATADINITGGLGSANTGDEDVTGNFDVIYSFKNATAGTNNWDNFVVEIFDGNGQFLTLRADAFGWTAGEWTPGGDAFTADDGTKHPTFTGQPEDWATWAADMKDMDVTVSIKRTGSVFAVKYDMKGASGATYSFSTNATVEGTVPDALKVHIAGEKVNLTNVKFTNNAGKTDPTSGSGEKDTTTKAATPTTTAKGTTTPAKTGDVAPITALAAVAVVACAAVVVSRKKVTE